MLSVMALAFLIAFTLILARIVPPQPKVTPTPDVRLQAESPNSGLALPSGQLALECMSVGWTQSFIWLVKTDGTGLTQITSDDEYGWQPSWSPDGKRLVYGVNYQVWVAETDNRRRVVWAGPVRSGIDQLAWSPDGRLQITKIIKGGPEGDEGTRLIDLDTGQDILMADAYPIWSPDGKRIAYLTDSAQQWQLIDWITGGNEIVWVADANGRNARPIGQGYRPRWSPDGKRLAFLAGFLNSSGAGAELTQTVQIADMASGAVTTLARIQDSREFQLRIKKASKRVMGELAWSPNGLMLAIEMIQQDVGAILILNAETGAELARWQGRETIGLLGRTWSPDNRHLVVDVDTALSNGVGIMDVQTGEYMLLPGSSRASAWSPDGKWLALAQDKAGVLLVTPDLSVRHRIAENLDCTSVVWRPKR